MAIAISLYRFPGAFVHQWNVKVKDTPTLLKVRLVSMLFLDVELTHPRELMMAVSCMVWP